MIYRFVLIAITAVALLLVVPGSALAQTAAEATVKLRVRKADGEQSELVVDRTTEIKFAGK